MTIYSSLAKLCLCFAVCLTGVSKGLAQQNVSVNLSSGGIQAQIPLHVLQNGDITIPFSLYYGGNGLKVEDTEMRFGLGWRSNFEPSIIRELRGFPDDATFQGHSSFPVIKGWIRQTDIATKVENFTIGNDNNPATCADEVSDYNYMNTNLGDAYDTEADVFWVNAPGLNASFAFDKNQQIKVMPYQDLKITYTTASNGQISTFTVVNDKGLTYVFDQTYVTTQHISEVWTPSNLPAFQRDYFFYRNASGNSPLQYNARWYISSITDSKGNVVEYTFSSAESELSAFVKTNERAELIKYHSGISAYQKDFLYHTKSSYTMPKLSTIWVNKHDGLMEMALRFFWAGGSAESALGSMVIQNTGDRITFDYSNPFNKTNDQYLWGRKFLKAVNVIRNSCINNPISHKFTYYDVDFDLNTSYITGFDSITTAQDYWGYFNGETSNTDLKPPVWVYPDNGSVDKFKINEIPSYGGNVVPLPGANRTVNSNAKAGSLKRIIYPHRGVTEIEYENNEYFDEDVNDGVLGGGVRVSKLTHNDGLNTNVVTNYDYDDPATGITTGKATSIPSFAFVFPNDTTYGNWNDRVRRTTYRTFANNAPGSAVLYAKVTVSKTNGGKSVYEFNDVGLHGTSTSDWAEPTIYVGRRLTSAPTPCGSILPSFLSNGMNNYPFPVDPNYDFERGLLKKVSNYNETGDLVTEEVYTYERSHTSPESIWSLKYDNVGTVRAFSKYRLMGTVGNLLATKVTKVFNSDNPTLSVYTSETENMFYESTVHKNPTRIEKVNSDGNTLINRIKYTKDYTTTGSGDDQDEAVHNLKLRNINIPVENWQSIKISSTENYTGGSLTHFNKFLNATTSAYMYLPEESWAFSRSSGTTSFTPSAFSSGVFGKDAKYIKIATITDYDEKGRVKALSDLSRTSNTSLYSFDLNVANFANAKPTEIVYSSFDYEDINHVMVAGTNSIATPGRASNQCFLLATSNNLSKSITVSSTCDKLIFSCWIKDAAGAGNLTVTVTGTSYNVAKQLAFTTGSDWKYYQIYLDKPTVSPVTVTVQTSSQLKLDDILVYPSNSSVNTRSFFNYTNTVLGTLVLNSTLLGAETGLNGITKYFEYKGSVPYIVRDGDNNIQALSIQRSANIHTAYLDLPSISVTPSANPVYHNTVVTFSANPSGSLPCDAVVGYRWNFGDGSAEVTTATSSAQHTYTTPGKYQITCTIFANGFTGSTASTPVTTDPSAFTVLPAPVFPTICVSGRIEYTSSGTCVSVNNCSGVLASCSESKFLVSSVPGYSLTDIQSVSWFKQSPLGGIWIDLGSPTDPTVPLVVPFQTKNPATASYKIQAFVTMTNGATGYSNEISILNNF